MSARRQRFVVSAVGLALAFALSCGRTVTGPCHGQSVRTDTVWTNDSVATVIVQTCRPK